MKDETISGYMGTCVPAAMKGERATMAIATTYCTCASTFIGDLDETEFLDFVFADLKSQRPPNAIYLKQLAKMESCGKAAKAAVDAK